jgi:hypothetical protein
MGISQIDIMQTAQIEDLQDDVREIRDKLNLVVGDITALTTKMNQAIADADDINTVINAGYSVASGGGTAGVGILKRLDELYQQFEDHKYLPTNSSTPSNGSYVESHPPSHTSAAIWQTGGTVASGLNGTVQGNSNPRSTHTASATIASIAGVYTPEQTSVMTLKSKGEVRARKMARKLLNKVR